MKYNQNFALFVLAVSKKIEPSDVAKLNGYWEIEK
jgi:hypothetical protein